MIFSKNGVALVVLILSLLGVEVTDTAILDALSAIGTVVSLLVMIYNQLKRSNTVGFIFKKK